MNTRKKYIKKLKEKLAVCDISDDHIINIIDKLTIKAIDLGFSKTDVLEDLIEIKNLYISASFDDYSIDINELQEVIDSIVYLLNSHIRCNMNMNELKEKDYKLKGVD